MGGTAKIIGGISKIVNAPLKAVGKIIGGDVGDLFVVAADFAVNVEKGFAQANDDVFNGIRTGDFQKAWGGIKTTITVLVVAIAVVYSGFNPLVIMAAIVVLDAQFNGSAFLLHLLDIVGSIEHALFGTNYIDEYKEIIAGALVMISTFYVGYMAFQYISDMGWVKSLEESYTNLYSAWGTLGKVMTGYDVYGSLKSILESKEYWQNLLEQYVSDLQAYINSIASARQQWFEIYSDTATIGRVLAGGDIYNAGAGSSLYSVSDAYEPYRYMTGIVSTNLNEEMDVAVNSDRYYYGMSGSDVYLENLLKG
jgi:hypothetical protein